MHLVNRQIDDPKLPLSVDVSIFVTYVSRHQGGWYPTFRKDSVAPMAGGTQLIYTTIGHEQH